MTSQAAEKNPVIIAGAGFAGAVCARKLADSGIPVTILEKRDHIGGNAYDFRDENGLLIHKYGPHIFHTANKEVFDFLSRFTEWNGYEHKVLANVYGKLIPVPFNLVSLYESFPSEKAASLEQKLVNIYGRGENVSILELLKAEDSELLELGKYIYENVFEKYTVKQWDMPPEKIDPATTARVPVRISGDCRYFTDTYQGLPRYGYTKLFENMLDHPLIDIRLEADASACIALRGEEMLYLGERFDGKFVYTGELDTLLGFKYGALPYRTLQFEFETVDAVQFQPCGTVNYTVDMPYTRITEFKHMTLDVSPKTVILREYSKNYTPSTKEIPYYPIIDRNSVELYEKYKEEIMSVKGIYLVGRLAEYRYYNMDAAAARGLQTAKEIMENL